MAVATVTITGNVYDPEGVGVTKGTVSCKLSQPGSALDGAASVRVAGEGQGNITAGGLTGLTLVPNDAITPSGTYYIAVFDVTLATGRKARWAEKWQLASSPATTDIGAVPRLDVVPGVALGLVNAPLGGDVSAGVVTPTGATTARSLRDRAADVVNVKDFGAKGDGTAAAPIGTDDTAAFQAAINSGRPVVVPPGVYYIGGTLYLPTTPVRITGQNANRDGSGSRGTTHIHAGGPALFAPAVASSYGSISKAQIYLAGLSLQAASPTVVAFDRMNLSASRITDCRFSNFKHVLYGTLTGVSSFDHNIVIGQANAAFKRLDAGAFDPNLTAPVGDSGITDNYFNGAPGVSAPTFYLLDIPSAHSAFIERNYFDYAYGGIYAGGANGLVTIRGNTFDILFRAIELSYGAFSMTIDGNRFFRMRKASAAYFTNPTAEMVSNDWTCIYLQTHVRELVVANNVHRDSERFIDLIGKWYKNIREWGTVGRTLTAPVVRMASRTIDEAGYVGIGEAGDGTGLQFASMEGQQLASVPDPVKGSYDGHRFWLDAVFVVNRAGRFYGSAGSETFGRKNLAPAGVARDFSTGWPTATGVTFPGGVLTINGAALGWLYSDTLATPLPPGNYLVAFNISTISGGSYLSSGIRLDNGTNVAAVTGGYAAGYVYNTITVPAGRTGVKFAIYNGSAATAATVPTFVAIRTDSTAPDVVDAGTLQGYAPASFCKAGASAQSDSAAADVAALRADFNALLAKLRAIGALAQ